MCFYALFSVKLGVILIKIFLKGPVRTNLYSMWEQGCMQAKFPLVNQSHLNKQISLLLTKVTSYIRLWFFISVSALDEANNWCAWKLAQCLLNISLQLVHTSVQGEINRKSRWWYFPFFFFATGFYTVGRIRVAVVCCAFTSCPSL